MIMHNLMYRKYCALAFNSLPDVTFLKKRTSKKTFDRNVFFILMVAHHLVYSLTFFFEFTFMKC